MVVARAFYINLHTNYVPDILDLSGLNMFVARVLCVNLQTKSTFLGLASFSRTAWGGTSFIFCVCFFNDCGCDCNFTRAPRPSVHLSEFFVCIFSRIWCVFAILQGRSGHFGHEMNTLRWRGGRFARGYKYFTKS